MVMYVLFQRRGAEACWYQQQLMSGWLLSEKAMKFFKEGALETYKIDENGQLVKSIEECQSVFKRAMGDPSGSLEHKLYCLLMINSFSETNEVLLEEATTLVEKLISPEYLGSNDRDVSSKATVLLILLASILEKGHLDTIFPEILIFFLFFVPDNRTHLSKLTINYI